MDLDVGAVAVHRAADVRPVAHEKESCTRSDVRSSAWMAPPLVGAGLTQHGSATARLPTKVERVTKTLEPRSQLPIA